MKNPRILIVTPEITYLPEGMTAGEKRIGAKAGGLADVSASLVTALFELGADVHVAIPHYRHLFDSDDKKRTIDQLSETLPDSRIHLAEDRVFYYQDKVYNRNQGESFKMALAFQREVINNIIPRVKPDLIHCNDWMTGLIPAFARVHNIPSLLTLHNIHTQLMSLEYIEDRGIDAASFWQNLYFMDQPYNYEHAREKCAVDLLTSGIFASHFINTVSPTFLEEIVRGEHRFVRPEIRREVEGKFYAGCASGILNAPDESYDPNNDRALVANFNPNNDIIAAKKTNKCELQSILGLAVNPEAPMLFWPSRLDPVQKGPELLSDILYHIVDKYWDSNLQVAIIADGPYQQCFHDIIDQHGFYDRVAVHSFNESLSRLGYAASDFMMMPSRFEPCGLPQMVSPIYGTLPLVHNTGGLHDTVTNLDVVGDSGNGFRFDHYDSGGLLWSIDQAMKFYVLPAEVKQRQLSRIMQESKIRFSHATTAQDYINIYENMLDKKLVRDFSKKD